MTQPETEKYDGVYNSLGKPDKKIGPWSVFTDERARTFRIQFKCAGCKEGKEIHLHALKVADAVNITVKHCRRQGAVGEWSRPKTSVIPKDLIDYLKDEATKLAAPEPETWDDIERQGQRIL